MPRAKTRPAAGQRTRRGRSSPPALPRGVQALVAEMRRHAAAGEPMPLAPEALTLMANVLECSGQMLLALGLPFPDEPKPH